MSTFKRYIMFQLMMFVFGIVGDVLIALWLTHTTSDDKAPTDTRTALALAKRMQGRNGEADD